MLSLVNVALGISIKALFDKITIDPVIYEALVEHKGKLGELAGFMDAYNAADYNSADAFLKKINPSATLSDILEMNTDALMYLEEVKKSGLV